MTGLLERFAHEYDDALQLHVAAEGEEGLAVAHDLGRWAMSHGLGLLDVVAAHQSSVRNLTSITATARPADQFLLQSLAAFEMAQRGFWEVQERVKVEEVLLARLQAVTAGSIAIMNHAASDERLAEFVEQARLVVVRISRGNRAVGRQTAGLLDGPRSTR